MMRILREADTGLSAEELCRKHNISTQTFYRWRDKYGGMDLKEAQRLRNLEKENAELKKLLADHLRQALAIIRMLEHKGGSHPFQYRLVDRSYLSDTGLTPGIIRTKQDIDRRVGRLGNIQAVEATHRCQGLTKHANNTLISMRLFPMAHEKTS